MLHVSLLSGMSCVIGLFSTVTLICLLVLFLGGSHKDFPTESIEIESSSVKTVSTPATPLATTTAVPELDLKSIEKIIQEKTGSVTSLIQSTSILPTPATPLTTTTAVPELDQKSIKKIVQEIQEDWSLNRVAWYCYWKFMALGPQQWVISVVKGSANTTVGVPEKYSENISLKTLSCILVRHKDLSIIGIWYIL